jgi:hypothetical protein
VVAAVRRRAALAEALMPAVYYVWFIASAMLVLVFLAATLRALELIFPSFSAWLDRHVGAEPFDEWRRW